MKFFWLFNLCLGGSVAGYYGLGTLIFGDEIIPWHLLLGVFGLSHAIASYLALKKAERKMKPNGSHV